MFSFLNENALPVITTLFVLLIIFMVVFVVSFVVQLKARKKVIKAKNEAIRANKAKSEFLSRMSHDIRTPLNGIIGMTEIAQMDVKNTDRVKDCLENISLSSGHLLSLINDVLDMSRIESGKTIMSKEPMDIRVLVDTSMSILTGLLAGRDITLDVKQGKILHPFVYGDELHLRQIIVNILSNAVKFTPDGGSISVNIQAVSSESEDEIMFIYSVKDSGVGMSKDFIKHVFEPFSQEKSDARTMYHGTGLGMSITKQFVDAFDGEINIESEVGRGTRVEVRIPLTVDEAAADTDIDGTSIVVPDERTDFTGCHVLLVEDNKLNKQIAKFMLEKIGMIVDVAENGQEGLEKFAASEIRYYDVILMDIMMPVLDGYECTRKIRSMDRFDSASVPIIAMTANAFVEDVQSALRAGMNAHISKPVDMGAMISTIGRFIK